jgi:hypothetical protein
MPAYKQPEIRERLKKKIMKGDKGGDHGQWSARKAQLLASEYKKACEKKGVQAYSGSKKSASAKNLVRWGKEN